MKQLKKIRIFVASPNDVVNERARIESIANSLKPLADFCGVSLETTNWRQVVPDMGRPQKIIFDQLDPTTWDVFVGILWQRFGSPSGGRNLLTNKPFISGTEEEFTTAYSLWRAHGRPRIMIYRCVRQVSLDAIDVSQLKKVNRFFSKFDAIGGSYPGLYQTFDSTEAFEKLLLDNLQRILIEYREKTSGESANAKALQAVTAITSIGKISPSIVSFGKQGIPELDMYATKDEIILEYSIPGMTAEALECLLEGSTFSVRGVLPLHDSSAEHFSQERLHGEFARSVEIPVPFEDNSTKAKYFNGKLTVTFRRKN